MANKTQAKAAIDSAATAIKADIDNILPVGVNIEDGSISFAPLRWKLVLDAGGSLVTADSWLATIVSNLTAASRTSTVGRFRRISDGVVNLGDKVYLIHTELASYKIKNF